MMRAASDSPSALCSWLAVGALIRQILMILTCRDCGDESGGREFAAHVGDQGVLKHSPQLLNLIGGQLYVRSLSYRLRQLVGYPSGQDSGPFSFCDKGSLGDRGSSGSLSEL